MTPLRSRLLAGLLLVSSASAADLQIRYGALERLIGEQIFTQEGRKWLKGTAKTPCQFAYIEKPRIGADGDRIRVVAKFTGRSAVGVLGGCIGLGDAFDFTLTALPVTSKGAIYLQNAHVTTAKDSFYIRRVRAALEQSFGKDFKIDVKDPAKYLLEQPLPNVHFQQELSSFNLNAVRVLPDALVLEVEFKLIVK